MVLMLLTSCIYLQIRLLNNSNAGKMLLNNCYIDRMLIKWLSNDRGWFVVIFMYKNCFGNFYFIMVNTKQLYDMNT